MAKIEAAHQGKKIEIRVQVMVDGQEVPSFCDWDAEVYTTPKIPYVTFATPLDLARAWIESGGPGGGD